METEEIHHKKPLSEGGTHDRSNLIALCKSCHSSIHAHRGDYCNVSKCLISNRNLDKLKIAILGTSKNREVLVNTGYFKI